MGLFKGRKTSVGLDIGSSFVKVAEVDHGGDRPEVSRLGVRPMPPGAVVDGHVVEPDQVLDAVVGVIDAASIKTTEAVTALGGHDVFIKKVRMPRMEGSAAGKAVRREARRHVPFDIESVRLDFHILRRSQIESNMAVLLIAAKRERVRERVALLAEAGIRISLMDVEAFALHNAFTVNYPGAADGVVALVDVGSEITGINILRDGEPVLIRDLPSGSRKLAAALRRDAGLTVEEAEDAVRGRVRPDGLDRALKAAADDLAAGIERVSALLKIRRAGTGMGRIYLSGGGVCTPGMADALSSRLKVETRMVNPFRRVPVRTDVGGHLSEEAAPMMLLALGLALRAP